jgi:hypothetical protein
MRAFLAFKTVGLGAKSNLREHLHRSPYRLIPTRWRRLEPGGEPSIKKLFAVRRTPGTSRKPGISLEEQEEWASQAAFMNASHFAGFVLFGGPLEGTPGVLLIIRLEDASEIQSRLSADFRAQNGLLRISQVAPWMIRLGKIAR